jgi:type II secretory ATPase GspE/PulE/Tfp pilus assembly ATPase PilB-like protein
MISLRQDGFAKVRQGRTTVEEVLRVTETEG